MIRPYRGGSSQSQASVFVSTKLAEAELAYINADYQKVENVYFIIVEDTVF